MRLHAMPIHPSLCQILCRSSHGHIATEPPQHSHTDLQPLISRHAHAIKDQMPGHGQSGSFSRKLCSRGAKNFPASTTTAVFPSVCASALYGLPASHPSISLPPGQLPPAPTAIAPRPHAPRASPASPSQSAAAVFLLSAACPPHPALSISDLPFALPRLPRFPFFPPPYAPSPPLCSPCPLLQGLLLPALPCPGHHGSSPQLLTLG